MSKLITDPSGDMYLDEMADDFDYSGLIDALLKAGNRPAQIAADVIRSMSRTLRALDKALGERDHYLTVELPAPEHVRPVPQQQIRSLRTWRQYRADPMAFAAHRMGTDTDAYRRWVMSDGWPHCGEKTPGGRCRNTVGGEPPRTISEWLRLDGKFCIAHGGDPVNGKRTP